MREMVSAGLAAKGRAVQAALAKNPAASLMHPLKPVPGGAHVILFDAFPHSRASFYVGLVDDIVFYLTEAPEEFTSMMRACGLRIDRPEVAVSVARAYIETTRSMRQFSGVIDSVDDIRMIPCRDAEEERLCLDATARLRGIVDPPSARKIGSRYVITAYVLCGSDLDLRTLTITEDCEIASRNELIASDLPVPLSM
ncbi:hypothetical protein [Actinoallomurus sp. CA-142502]|uniref:hypothetical protein n=1 Tax=Actinoallomurus sp. CA-142502 TaxID=3239885 RepID=UPI003D937C41